MPILEALGLRVVEEVPTAIAGEGRVYIHDFGVLDSRGAVLELGNRRIASRTRSRPYGAASANRTR